MAIVEQGDGESLSPSLAIKLPKVPWTQILAISIFWLALNFHWAALGIIILPSQVFKIMVSRCVKTQKEGSIRATFLLSTPVFSTVFAQTFWKYTSAGVW